MIRFQTSLSPFEGCFLVANVTLKDPFFSRKVVLLVEHNQENSVGIILNHRIEVLMQKDNQPMVDKILLLYQGGPVGKNTLQCLHNGKDERIQDGKRVLENLYWGGQMEDVTDLLQHRNDTNIRFFMGYSGWAPEQLNHELKEKHWYILKAPASFVFETPIKSMWEIALEQLGERYSLLKLYPEDLSLH